MNLFDASGRALRGDADYCDAVVNFWENYYNAARTLHYAVTSDYTMPFKSRPLLTTTSQHVSVLERYWAWVLASKLGVSPDEVGKRTIRFREHAQKSFDVCYPMHGEPIILISVKSMQNAFRNLTNRVEEAFGDTAVLRLYHSNAAFGFFFSVVDGSVARGIAEQGEREDADELTGKKPIAPFLTLIEDGGDFFSTSNIDAYRKVNPGVSRGRQDNILKTQSRLIDLLAEMPTREASIHYDAIAYAPVGLRNLGTIESPTWEVSCSQVDERLQTERFVDKLIAVARLRGLL